MIYVYPMALVILFFFFNASRSNVSQESTFDARFPSMKRSSCQKHVFAMLGLRSALLNSLK